MTHVFELIDSSDDEMYYPQGFFSTIELARAHIAENPATEHAEDFCENTIICHELDKPYARTTREVYKWEYSYEEEKWLPVTPKAQEE